MAQQELDFALLMQRYREGSPDAARELFERYGPHILRVVRRKLLKRLRSKYDSVDFTQAVWASFFTLPPKNYSFDAPEKLIAYLVHMAQNKVREEIRRRHSRKHDVSRENSLDHSARVPAQKLADPRTQTPSKTLMAEEQYERLAGDQPTRHHRYILMLLRQGKTHAEIAGDLGIHVKTVQRILKRMELELNS